MRPNPNGSNTNLHWTLRWCVYFQIWSLHQFLEDREKVFVNLYPNITKKLRSPVISLSLPRFLAPLRERSVKSNSRKCNLLHQRMQDLMERTGYIYIYIWPWVSFSATLAHFVYYVLNKTLCSIGIKRIIISKLNGQKGISWGIKRWGIQRKESLCLIGF